MQENPDNDPVKKVVSPVPAALTLLFSVFCLTAQADIGYQFVTVGNPGNANDTTGYGAVDYNYDIGTYDVTLNQYAAFLNAVAQSDPYGLYNSNLGTNLNIAGISRSESGTGYSYSVLGDGQRPVAYVSWLDAARFTNWVQNGQPMGLGEVAGSTEQGAYTLNGDTTSGLETKNANATYWIPSENEWYKAAYYDPNYGGSGTGGYWAYATKSNTAPGNVIGKQANQANYDNGVYSVTQVGTYGYAGSFQNYLTDVGAFSGSASAYGTYDQSGDLYNWNDAVVGSSRDMRGGDWETGSGILSSSWRYNNNPTFDTNYAGFRIASAVPEPSVVVNLVLAGGLMIVRRKRI